MHKYQRVRKKTAKENALNFYSSRSRKVLLFGDELRVKAGGNSELTVRVDMFYILEQAS